MTRYKNDEVYPGKLSPMNLQDIQTLANKGHSIRVYSEEEVKQIVSAVLRDTQKAAPVFRHSWEHFCKPAT